MRLWLNRTGEVSLREQLITQVVLGILTREMPPGERLPSTRELARRFGIHPNTASAAYRELEQEGWLEFRHGSGVFVRATPPHYASLARRWPSTSSSANWQPRRASSARPTRFCAARLRRWLSFEPPARWLVIEPDPELRNIVISRWNRLSRCPWPVARPRNAASRAFCERSIPVILPSKAAMVRKLLPAGTELTVLQVQPRGAPQLQANLQRYLPEHAADLIGIASRWSEFQRIGRTMIVAAGLKPGESFGARCDPPRLEARPGIDLRRHLRHRDGAATADKLLPHRLSPARRLLSRNSAPSKPSLRESRPVLPSAGFQLPRSPHPFRAFCGKGDRLRTPPPHPRRSPIVTPAKLSSSALHNDRSPPTIAEYEEPEPVSPRILLLPAAARAQALPENPAPAQPDPAWDRLRNLAIGAPLVVGNDNGPQVHCLFAAVTDTLHYPRIPAV